MAITLEEKFQVEAPRAQTWAYISDPMRVAPCLPGAELTEVVDETTYKGRVQVRVGPITAKYEGTAHVERMDADSGTITLLATGNQVGAVGRAESRITATVKAPGGNSTEVTVSATLQIGGRLAQFGSGMIERVGKMLFSKFADCAKQAITAQSGATTENAS